MFGNPGRFDFHHSSKSQGHRCPCRLGRQTAIFGFATDHIGRQCDIDVLGMGEPHRIHIADKVSLVGAATNSGVKRLFLGNRTHGSAAVVMARINKARVRQGQDLLSDGVVKRAGITLLKIGTTATPDQKRVTGEGPGLVFCHVRQAAVCVSRRGPNLE